jgi:hypothetical protein
MGYARGCWSKDSPSAFADSTEPFYFQTICRASKPQPDTIMSLTDASKASDLNREIILRIFRAFPAGDFFSIFPLVPADMFCCIRIHLLAQAYLRLLPLHTILSCSKSSNPTTPTLSKSTFDWIILQTRSNLPVNQTLCSLHFNLITTVTPVNCKSLQGRGCSPLFFCKVC